MKILFIGKFKHLHDEEYIARSFESLGHDVIRLEQSSDSMSVHRKIITSKPDVVLFTKYIADKYVKDAFEKGKEWGMKTVCWLFDLYWGYTREFRLKNDNYFKADYVFTTDGGDHDWKSMGINHHVVRQGIYSSECVLLPFDEIKHDIVFVGTENPLYTERTKMVRELNADWYGRKNSDQLRGMALNELYASTRVVIGDSYYSPHYWSNRVVETLGRGGFLIHRDVPGIKEEYPDLVTYDGTIEDLRAKIEYYKEHEDERREIISKNFNHVKNNYTMDKKCNELCQWINQ